MKTDVMLMQDQNLRNTKQSLAQLIYILLLLYTKETPLKVYQMHDTSILIQNNQTNLCLLNLLLHNWQEQIKNINVQ